MSTLVPAAAGGVLDALPESAPDRSKAASRERVDYIGHFRAVAIVLIISGHAFDLAWTRAANEHALDSVPLLEFVAALINGGTFFFVFISGFLYRYVFYQRISFGDFMRKKALYVGSPYLLLGTALALFQMVVNGFHVTIEKHGAFLGENPFVDLLVQLGTGQMMTAYWYIPFIFIIFVASPLFDRFIRMQLGAQLAIFGVALGVGFWVHRPYESLDPFHSVAYFVSAYLFGIIACEHRKRLVPLLMSTASLLVLTVAIVSLALYQDLVLHNPNLLERVAGDGFMPKAFDWMIVQKYLGILFLVGFLARFGSYANRPLLFLADRSFGMYFMHGIVLTAFSHAPSWISPHVGTSLVDFVVYAAATVLTSLLAVVVVKAVTGRHSRYVIGS